MSGMQPWKIIVIGFVLVLFGFVAPFLMVIQVVESSLILSFLSYLASVMGLFLGLIGAALYVRINRS
jgi:hypothetical protein